MNAAIRSTLAKMNLPENSVDYFAQDRDDYLQSLLIKKWELGEADSWTVNASFRNIRVNFHKGNVIRKDAIGYVDSLETPSVLFQVEARELCKFLQSKLTSDEWYLLMSWFMGNKVGKTSTFYRRVNTLLKKCKRILTFN